MCPLVMSAYSCDANKGVLIIGLAIYVYRLLIRSFYCTDNLYTLPREPMQVAI